MADNLPLAPELLADAPRPVEWGGRIDLGNALLQRQFFRLGRGGLVVEAGAGYCQQICPRRSGLPSRKAGRSGLLRAKTSFLIHADCVVSLPICS